MPTLFFLGGGRENPIKSIRVNRKIGSIMKLETHIFFFGGGGGGGGRGHGVEGGANQNLKKIVTSILCKQVHNSYCYISKNA